MKRTGRGALLMTLVAALAFPSPARSTPVEPVLGAGTAGTLTRSGTTWTIADELFDATGPDLDGVDPTAADALRAAPAEDVPIAASTGVFGSQRATPGGDFALPSDRARWPDFTADIAGVRLDVRGATVEVAVRFTSMPRPDAQIATVTFASTVHAGPARPWPAGAGVRGPWQAALTLASERATLVGVDGSEWSVGRPPEDHTVRASVPLSALPARPWRVVVGAGLADPATPSRYWPVEAGSPLPDRPAARGATAVALWDLALVDRVGHPTTVPRREREQARVLALGDVSPAAVDLSGARGAGDAAVRTGTMTRSFASRWDGGDGIVRDPSGVAELGPPPVPSPLPDPGPGTGWTYTGRLQHYGVHVPDGYRQDVPAPLLVYLHGSGGDVDELFRAFPDLVRALSDRGFLIASPLGRGDTFYRPGPGELDVLEAIADVRRTYRVDADRIFLVGFSGGAAGVNVVASRHPDLFAGTVSVAATFEEPTLVDNIATVPWLGIMGEGDPVSQGLDAPGLYQALSDRGGDATLIRYAAKTHEFSLVYDSIPQILELLETRRRDPAPPRVTWVTKVGDERPLLGLARDGAWWVGEVTPADPTRNARVSARSLGRGWAPGDADRAEAVTGLDGAARSGRGLARLSTTRPDVRSVPAENLLVVDASNVRRVRIDLAATGLTSAAPLTIDVTTDVALDLLLADGADLDLVMVPSGTHRLVRRG